MVARGTENGRPASGRRPRPFRGARTGRRRKAATSADRRRAHPHRHRHRCERAPWSFGRSDGAAGSLPRIFRAGVGATSAGRADLAAAGCRAHRASDVWDIRTGSCGRHAPSPGLRPPSPRSGGERGDGGPSPRRSRALRARIQRDRLHCPESRRVEYENRSVGRTKDHVVRVLVLFSNSDYRSKVFADYYLTDRSFSFLTKFCHEDDWHAFLPETIACSLPVKRAYVALRFRSMPPWPVAALY